MPHFRVLLRGENFLLTMEGKLTRMGFYTTRLVDANNREGAELLAIELVRQDNRLREAVRNERSAPPMIFADQIDVIVANDVSSVPSGFTFFPMDGTDA